MADKGKALGGDGLGTTGAAAPGSSKSGGIMAALRAQADTIVPTTLLPNKQHTTLLNAVFKEFRATTEDAKNSVIAAMIIFFAVHGTSTNASWASVPHVLSANGTEVRPEVVVNLVGADSLKKFMGRYSGEAVAFYKEDVDFRSAMRERVARYNLPESEGYLVIDYVGKDGSLDARTMKIRGQVRKMAVTSRDAATVEAAAVERATETAARETTTGGVDPFSSW